MFVFFKAHYTRKWCILYARVKSSGRYLLNDKPWELRAGLGKEQYLTFLWIIYLKMRRILVLLVELQSVVFNLKKKCIHEWVSAACFYESTNTVYDFNDFVIFSYWSFWKYNFGEIPPSMRELINRTCSDFVEAKRSSPGMPTMKITWKYNKIPQLTLLWI